MKTKISFNKFQGRRCFLEIEDFSIILEINKDNTKINEVENLPEKADKSYAGNYIDIELIKAAFRKAAEIIVNRLQDKDQEYSYYAENWYKRSYFGEIYLDTDLGKLFDKLPKSILEIKLTRSNYVGEYRGNSYYKPIIKNQEKLVEAIFIWLLLNVEVEDYFGNPVF